ncbi:uncharacterized protein LOC110278762 [Arachis duranensis]|uniref:Uncharacterized protein LOC110278762 n=1 Tax=Arachis duranensis TaxID=130453 RepID=A0A6P5N761_ARADU|nr:uncharacterized protein LOC110278762 [Arachis duranensis]
MANNSPEDGHATTDSEQENLNTGNNEADMTFHQEANDQHKEGTSGVKNPKVNSFEGRESGKEGPPHAAELMGLVHDHQECLEQLEQELERQREAERNLREEIERRKETMDPKHHLNNIKSRMYLADASDATRCKAFLTALSKAAMKWFDSLPPRSVTSFDDLSQKFLMRFSIQKDKVKHAPSLLGVKQEDREPLRNYMEMFNKACLEIQDMPTEAVIMSLVNGLGKGSFSQSISKRHPTSLNDVQERVEKYINIEENARLQEPSWRLGHSHLAKEKEREPKKKEEIGVEKPRRYHSNTPLKVFLVDVYRKIRHTERLPPLGPSRTKKGGVMATTANTIKCMAIL